MFKKDNFSILSLSSFPASPPSPQFIFKVNLYNKNETLLWHGLWEISKYMGFVSDDSGTGSVLFLWIQNVHFSYCLTSQIIWERSARRIFACVRPLEFAKKCKFPSSLMLLSNQWIAGMNQGKREWRRRDGLCKTFKPILKQTHN